MNVYIYPYLFWSCVVPNLKCTSPRSSRWEAAFRLLIRAANWARLLQVQMAKALIYDSRTRIILQTRAPRRFPRRVAMLLVEPDHHPQSKPI